MSRRSGDLGDDKGTSGSATVNGLVDMKDNDSIGGMFLSWGSVSTSIILVPDWIGWLVLFLIIALLVSFVLLFLFRCVTRELWPPTKSIIDV